MISRYPLMGKARMGKARMGKARMGKARCLAFQPAR